MARIETLRPKYKLEQSPLYRLHSRKRLAVLLGWPGSVKDLEAFARRPDNFKFFDANKNKAGKKPRLVQEPKDALQGIHRRMASLLARIETPEYLHSGLRGRSYVTNGRQHVNDMPAVKLDVKQFYPSTKWAHVYRFFSQDSQCVPDVCGLLSTLACVSVDGAEPHLPTGSCLSQMLAFYAHRSMFEEIWTYVRERGGVLSVYVDDITASMPHASRADIPRLGRIITKYGLQWHKDRFFPCGTPKRVTGTIAKVDRLEADKKQHLNYAKARAQVGNTDTPLADQQRAARRAVGILQSIAQVDARMTATARGMTQKLSMVAGL